MRSAPVIRRRAAARAFRGAVVTIAMSASVGCGHEMPVTRAVILDDFGDALTLRARPSRIVSLNPTTTELLYAIGAGPRIVGRTSWDLWPAEVRAVPDLGPGIRPNVEAVIAARPDLVLLYASQDNRDAARRLRAAGIATAAYRVDRIADFHRVVRALGRITGDTAAARLTSDTVAATLERVRAATSALPHPKVFWPLWESPLLTVGGGSFLNELLVIAGGRNVYDSLAQPSPAVAFEDLLKHDPDLLLASPASRERILHDPRWRTLRAVREGRVLTFDTTIVNGPSNRVGTSAVNLANILHPGAVR